MSKLTVGPSGPRPAAPVSGNRAAARRTGECEQTAAKAPASRFDRVELSGAARSLRTAALNQRPEPVGSDALDRLLSGSAEALDRRLAEALDRL